MDISEVINDPQTIANGHIVEVEHPEFGQHTEEMLLGLNYTWEEISELKEKGIVIFLEAQVLSEQ